MLKRLLIAAAASGLAATEAAAQAAPLPDFPAQARPGECWARVPAGPVQSSASGAQAVWTLQRGTGPTAIWSLSERPVPAVPTAGAVLDWAQVDCVTGRPLQLAYAAPSLGPAPRAAPLPPPGPYAQAEPGFPPPPPPPGPGFEPGPRSGPGPGPQFGPPAYSGRGPYAQGGFPPPHRFGEQPLGEQPFEQQPFGAQPPFPAPHAGPPSPYGYPAVAQPRRPVAPWFGGRYLTWPGKTLR